MEKYRLLFESVFKKKLTDTDTVSYLERLTAEHPYFSVAQFYLLQLSESNTNAFKLQARKTTALFNNNYWLNFQLLEAGADNKSTIAVSPVLEEAAIAETYVEEKTEPIPADNNSTESFIAAVNVDTALQDEKLAEEIKDEESRVIEPVVENVEEVASTKIDEHINAEPATEEIQYNASSDVIEASEPVIENMASTPIKESKTTEEVVMKTPADTKPADEPLLFEPLHTTDYFASVGIKLSEEEKSSGKLGKQLKSFTEWLKTMKKVHADQLIQAAGPAEVEAASAESNIQKLAERSNEEDQIITEAMAEVLLQQGKKEKALEILEKLSLLNPSKSIYFAAKINQIKEK